jgi:hypothetical protein
VRQEYRSAAKPRPPFLNAVSSRRHLRRQVLPALGMALQPLHPSEAEIAEILSELKIVGHRIGARLRAANASAQLRSDASPSRNSPARQA